MNAELNQPKPGMTTKKKWIIGCGGCLGVVIIGAIALAVLGGLGFNALKEASGSSVKEIFGASYKPETAGYQAIGLPLKQGKLKNMVLLLNAEQGWFVVALDMEAKAADMQVLKSGKPELIRTYLEKTSAEVSDSAQGGSSKIQDLRFNPAQLVPVGKGKTMPVAAAVAELEGKKGKAYGPAVAALVPEAGQHLVVLVATSPAQSSTDPNADFSAEQKNLQDLVLKIVKDSELDDRLQ